MALDRRAFLRGAGALLGLGAAGCAPAPAPRPRGRLLGPDLSAGHRLRQGAFGEPATRRDTDVLIVGGGIAGLSAAWWLRRAGVDRFALLEMEPELGGNARAGRSDVTGFPWGAHYLPLPTREGAALVELLEDLGAVTGRRADGSPVYDETMLLTPPHERLFQYGLWRQGLRPLGSSRAEAQFARFDGLVEELARTRTADGRPAFTTPSRLSSRDAPLVALDGASMAQWLDRHGLDHAALRWYVEYACRDDFGSRLGGTSAWAGLHYYAGRKVWGPYAEGQMLTWPEGNSWIVKHLQRRLQAQVLTSRMAVRVRDERDGVVVDAWDGRQVERWRARHLLLCVPGYVIARILPDAPVCAREYHPWLVANLHVSRLPAGSGAGQAWDSVIYDGPSLGYVCATHQHRVQHTGASVLTYYRPYAGGGQAARRELLETGWERAAAAILDELRIAHPDIDEVVEQLDIWRWGHGMVSPAPGLRSSAALARAGRSRGRIHFAHSDLAGMSLFEEAHDQGIEAARKVLATL
jgi:phytoene dehydrogenase-like protein